MRDVSAPRIDRPELTLPEAEAALLRAEYAAASVILEYGSGGSTVLAGEMPGKRVFSVESDPDWAAMMRDWFAQTPPASPVEVIHADIGPTKEWGHPKSHHGWRSYPAYPLGVWELDEIPHPDVVLVDGRFRVGCALATAFRAQRPVVLLFDDYAGRQAYHVIEDYLGTPELTGRMARFEVTPQPVPAERLLQVIQLMQRP
ncbi:hypothetical protein GLS40_04160 [Pseudooceanicola sp. 216_PA32_1]|uniref:Methyltransferase domain-containing protein n=1 Tax=Pseudooceanicola pacificus TaxID=2676438 RepID=A0A844WCF6_9RHOB|nr:hypothetical protein [Pseudooceanicola pacificus]MWB77210.1 hypothetical protein [Pseudooceanicola pacificus]